MPFASIRLLSIDQRELGDSPPRQRNQMSRPKGLPRDFQGMTVEEFAKFKAAIHLSLDKMLGTIGPSELALRLQDFRSSNRLRKDPERGLRSLASVDLHDL